MKYIVMNDPHIDVRAPSRRRKDDYLEACFRKLNQVTDLCVEHDAQVLVCTGDWFHKKSPTLTPYYVTHRLAEWAHHLRFTAHIKLLSVLGNHDVQNNDFSDESIERQPIGMLVREHLIRRLDSTPFFPVGLTDFGFVGSDFRATVPGPGGLPIEDEAQFVVQAPTHPFRLIQVTHASVVPAAPVWRPFTLVERVAQLSAAEICHTGHIHENLGIHRIRREGGDFYWTNVGSLTRGSLKEDTIDRVPSVLLVEALEGREPKFTVLPLDHRPAEEIYDIEEYREEKAARKSFSGWTERLQKELNAETAQDKTLEEIVAESALDSRGRELALRLLNEAGA